MQAMLGIFRKELKIYFTTPIAYVVFALFTLVASVFFWSFLHRFMLESQAYIQMQRPEFLDQLNFNDRVITPLYVGYVQIIFLFLMPLLTMRLIADERRSKTLELLLSTPITPLQIVLGKYLAALVLVLALALIMLVYPTLLFVFGRGVGTAGPLDWMTVWMGLAGLVLVGASCIAVGLFTSTLTENQVVAAVIGMMLLLVLWILRGFGTGLDGTLGNLLTQLSIVSHIESFARGIFKLADLVYFGSIIAFFLFLSHRMVESLRWT